MKKKKKNNVFTEVYEVPCYIKVHIVIYEALLTEIANKISIKHLKSNKTSKHALFKEKLLLNFSTENYCCIFYANFI